MITACKFIASPFLSKKNLLKSFKVAKLPHLHIIHNTRFWTKTPIVRLFLVNTGFRGNILTTLNYCMITLQTLYSFPEARIFIQPCHLFFFLVWDTIPHTFQKSNKWITDKAKCKQNFAPLSTFLNIWKVALDSPLTNFF